VKYYTNKARQAGMTLIELTVVLLVLIGLAGLLIPYVSGFVSKTHDSTGSSNIQALNNAMIRYTVENYDSYPNKMDSLIQTTDNKVFSKMMNAMPTGYLAPFQLTSDEAASLNGVGITTMMDMDPAKTNATFDNVAGEIAVSKDAYVAIIRETSPVWNGLANILGKPVDTAGNYYVVMGVGEDSTISGATVADVPVHFAGRGDMSAELKYNHFVAVFQVPKAGGHCDIADMALDASAGDNAGVQSSNEVAATATAQAAMDAANPATSGTIPTTEATCDTLAAISTPGDAPEQISVAAGTGNNSTDFGDDPAGTAGNAGAENESWGVTGVVWVSGGSDAKFMGTAMAMMMNNFEGLGGALNNYYKKVN